jgi:hypothetical protein
MNDLAHRIQESALRVLPRRAILVILATAALAAVTATVRTIELKVGAIPSMLEALIKLCCVAG